MNLFFTSLEINPQFTKEVATIYFQEWGWHFEKDFNLVTYQEIRQDLEDHFLAYTYVLFDEVSNQLVGTVALLPEDLKHPMVARLNPWITCLYVKPEYRGQGYAKALFQNLLKKSKCKTFYAWTHEKTKCDKYELKGWKLLFVLHYEQNRIAYILQLNT